MSRNINIDNENSLLIVISGPSGVGKDTILKKLLSANDKIKLSVSATTRSPRSTEKDKADYFFMNKEEFLSIVDNDGMLEYAEYCGNFYGTPKKNVFDELRKGNDVVLEIETQGALKVINENPDTISIFIMPPSFNILKNRLENRNTDTIEIIKNRLEKAKLEIEMAIQYNYIVINDSLDDCVCDIINIINTEKMKSFRRKKFIKGVLIDG